MQNCKKEKIIFHKYFACTTMKCQDNASYPKQHRNNAIVINTVNKWWTTYLLANLTNGVVNRTDDSRHTFYRFMYQNKRGLLFIQDTQNHIICCTFAYILKFTFLQSLSLRSFIKSLRHLDSKGPCSSFNASWLAVKFLRKPINFNFMTGLQSHTGNNAKLCYVTIETAAHDLSI